MVVSDAVPSRTVLKVFVFTDVVDSTRLKQRLGDQPVAEILAAHDALFRQCLARHGGKEEKHQGDGFLASFDVPSHAALCALDFQQGLRGLEIPEALEVRIGIHMGEAVVVSEEAGSYKDFVGLAVDLASRVTNLAQGRQILLTRPSFDSARQQITAAPDGSGIQWLAHGPFLFKGFEEEVDVFEVGVPGIGVLTRPPDSEKARSARTVSDEITLGWRPAVGLPIEGRPGWLLDEKLGEGGFGEVWAARNEHTRDVRTFKFCFRVDRVRSLKRELTLFRLMKEVLGERPDIARLYDVRLDAPPFYLEMEYTRGGDLAGWAENQGGIENVALNTRIELVAQIAEAVAAAHAVGVIHKDIKPRNVLIEDRNGEEPQARLTDFGIGQLVDKEQLEQAGITVERFTTKSSSALTELESRSGTRLYMAPELLANSEPSIQSDIYSLGVVLYQAAIGDLDRPLGQGWERQVEDPLIRDDIAACVEGQIELRLTSAAELSRRLRSLDERREERAANERAAAQAAESRRQSELARRRRKLGLVIAAILLLVSVGAVGIALSELSLRRRAETQRERADFQAERALAEADKANQIKDFLVNIFSATDPRAGGPGGQVTSRQLLHIGARRVSEELQGQPKVQASLLNIIGDTFFSFGLYDDASAYVEQALTIQEADPDPDLAVLSQSLVILAVTHDRLGNNDLAEKRAREAQAVVDRMGSHGDEQRAETLLAIGLLYQRRHEYEAAEEVARQALELAENVFGRDSERLPLYLVRLGQILRSAGKLEESVRVQQQSVDLLVRTLGEDHVQTADYKNSLAVALMALGRRDRARQLYAEALPIQRRQYGNVHFRTLATLNNFVRSCELPDEFEKLERIALEMIEEHESRHGNNAPELEKLFQALKKLYERWGKADLVAGVDHRVDQLRAP